MANVPFAGALEIKCKDTCCPEDNKESHETAKSTLTWIRSISPGGGQKRDIGLIRICSRNVLEKIGGKRTRVYCLNLGSW